MPTFATDAAPELLFAKMLMNTVKWGSGKKVLLVEDDQAQRESMKHLLSIDHHTVTEAASGYEALRLFADSRYDLVITDYVMPGLRGDELARSLKELAPSQPILMVTAHTEILSNAGGSADAVLAKPFSLMDLRHAIATRVQRYLPQEEAENHLTGSIRPSACESRAGISTNQLHEEIATCDARKYVDAGNLTLWVQQEVESSGRCGSSSRHADSSICEMLQLLTFAYACNVLASDQIRATCRVNPAFRFLCNGLPPFASELATFRRRHRRQLELTLAGTLAKVASQGLNQTFACVYPLSIEAARLRLDIAGHLDSQR